MLSDGDLEKTTKRADPRTRFGVLDPVRIPFAATIRAITYVTKDPEFVEALSIGITCSGEDSGGQRRRTEFPQGGRA